MPAITIPYDHGYAIVLTDTCTVITNDGLFGGSASYMENTHKLLTQQEFQAINWRRILSARHDNIFDNPRLIVRVSIYGMDLSERATGIMRVVLRQFEIKHNNRSRYFFQARIKWLAYFQQLKERRTAVAMANHRRLGLGSMLSLIGSDALAVVAKFM
jgi:hypothetical protein